MKIKRLATIFIAMLLVLVIGAVSYRLISGRSLGLKEKLGQVVNLIQSVIGHNSVISMNTGDFTNVIFIHQSVGRNIIAQGNLREQFTQHGYKFWDQDYTYIGLTGPDGNPTGYSYDVPGDNTNIDGYANIFQQPKFGLPFNTFSSLLQHEVIIFKSCYPNSNIFDDALLDKRKQEYLSIRDRIDQYPDKIFFLLTSPPVNPAETTLDAGLRARELSEWLKSPDFTEGHPNFFVFDLYNYLAEKDPLSNEFNMLQVAYREGSDSHPNETANLLVASKLAEFVNQKIEDYRSQIGFVNP